MKIKLAPCLLTALWLFTAACSSTKEGDPAPPVITNPIGKYTITNNGAPLQAALAVQGYDDAVTADQITVHVATIAVLLPGNKEAAVKYYLTSLSPGATVNKIVARGYDANGFDNKATGTLTSREATVGARKVVYLSGAFTADLGPGYRNVVASFTDLL